MWKASQAPSFATSALWILKGDSLTTSSTRERGKLTARWGAMVGISGESFECSYFLLMLGGTHAIIGSGRAIWAMVPGPQSSGPGGRRLSCATFWTDVPGWRSATWWNRSRTQSIPHEIGIGLKPRSQLGRHLVLVSC